MKHAVISMKVKVKMLVVQCLALCNPLDCGPAGSSVHGILQARIWEWEPFPSPGDLLEPGIEPASLASLALAGTFFTPVPKSLSNRPVNHSGCNLRMSHPPTWKGKSDSTSSSLSIYQRGNRCREEKRLTGGSSLTPRLLWLSSEPSRASTPWSPGNVFKWMNSQAKEAHPLRCGYQSPSVKRYTRWRKGRWERDKDRDCPREELMSLGISLGPPEAGGLLCQASEKDKTVKGLWNKQWESSCPSTNWSGLRSWHLWPGLWAYREQHPCSPSGAAPQVSHDLLSWGESAITSSPSCFPGLPG